QRLFMGGGGGGGQQNDNNSSPGGNGGGIIIIKATTLRTECSGSVRISANGITPPDTKGGGNDGAGGGGAGGTVSLQVNNFIVPSSCPLAVQANGGNGSNVANSSAH